mmetsp:Transcript_47229/g.101090  ORF Transcript_47229/g.101090 Transcript_47229/m.101090 type:complete len:227 (+) Transcript_47229:461-1141(+)
MDAAFTAIPASSTSSRTHAPIPPLPKLTIDGLGKWTHFARRTWGPRQPCATPLAFGTLLPGLASFALAPIMAPNSCCTSRTWRPLHVVRVDIVATEHADPQGWDPIETYHLDPHFLCNDRWKKFVDSGIVSVYIRQDPGVLFPKNGSLLMVLDSELMDKTSVSPFPYTTASVHVHRSASMLRPATVAPPTGAPCCSQGCDDLVVPELQAHPICLVHDIRFFGHPRN